MFKSIDKRLKSYACVLTVIGWILVLMLGILEIIMARGSAVIIIEGILTILLGGFALYASMGLLFTAGETGEKVTELKKQLDNQTKVMENLTEKIYVFMKTGWVSGAIETVGRDDESKKSIVYEGGEKKEVVRKDIEIIQMTQGLPFHPFAMQLDIVGDEEYITMEVMNLTEAPVERFRAKLNLRSTYSGDDDIYQMEEIPFTQSEECAYKFVSNKLLLGRIPAKFLSGKMKVDLLVRSVKQNGEFTEIDHDEETRTESELFHGLQDKAGVTKTEIYEKIDNMANAGEMYNYLASLKPGFVPEGLLEKMKKNIQVERVYGWLPSEDIKEVERYFRR